LVDFHQKHPVFCKIGLAATTKIFLGNWFSGIVIQTLVMHYAT
jgi:hypothetical protein